MKKLLVSVFAFAFLFAGYNSAAYAAKNTDDKNCKHFKSKQEVMEFWYKNGYSATNDPHDLDRDNDGLPCEVKKGDYDQFVASKQATKQDENKEDAKQDTKQEPAKQENKQTTSKEESKTTKDTKKDNVVKKDTKKQGEKLPNTASNVFTMLLVSAGLVAAGSVLLFRRTKTNA
ncbi:excalibur calcium-binding domain-containing protein [Bacillus cereus]